LFTLYLEGDVKLIEIKNVNKWYGKKHIINDMNLEISKGDCVGLIGPNGAGKSTIIKMITGNISCSSGDVLYEKQPIDKLKSKIGYLPQHAHFKEWMHCEDTLILLGELSGLKGNALQSRVKEMLKLVGLEQKAKEKIATFSGGMKQRLGIAQALLHRPEFILLDEPVSALDPIGRKEVIHLIEKIRAHSTILLSTHILADAEQFCNRFIFIKEGKIIDDFHVTDFNNNYFHNLMEVEVMSPALEVAEKLRQQFPQYEVKTTSNLISIEFEDLWNQKDDVIRYLLNQNIKFTNVRIKRKTIEDHFIESVVSI